MFYKLYQNQNENNVKSYQKWYARAVSVKTVDTDYVAEVMQRNCTVKISDIKAVLPDVLVMLLESGCRVKLEGLGAFKVGLTSTGVAAVEDFSATTNIKGAHIVFQPEVEVDAATRHKTKKLLKNLTYSNITVLGSVEELAERAGLTQEP